ncbi:hypothetical protein LTR56_018092 [Elasticomyces elasticus]|nr:hypothetical protein LTR56_018092 [Elasticomyces elasticus]KAK3642506.1 hypothetical protein LTR22_016041 [Elasticomyces elasticus]KAK4908851.1 hypothetical protein LTR49_022289 [Elasticomyces elasticus]
MIANPWFKLLFGWTRGKIDETSERFRYFSRDPSASWRRMLVSQPPMMMRYCLGYDSWCYNPNRLKPGQAMRFSDLECADCLLVANKVFELTDHHELKGNHLWSEVEYGNQVKVMSRAEAGGMLLGMKMTAKSGSEDFRGEALQSFLRRARKMSE